MKRQHQPSKMNSHMQIFYPDTTARLQPPYGELTRRPTPSEYYKDPALHRTRGMRDEVPFATTHRVEQRARAEVAQDARQMRVQNKAKCGQSQISLG